MRFSVIFADLMCDKEMCKWYAVGENICKCVYDDEVISYSLY